MFRQICFGLNMQCQILESARHFWQKLLGSPNVSCCRLTPRLNSKSHVTSCLGLQKKEPLTAYPMSIMWVSPIASTVGKIINSTLCAHCYRQHQFVRVTWLSEKSLLSICDAHILIKCMYMYVQISCFNFNICFSGETAFAGPVKSLHQVSPIQQAYPMSILQEFM